MNEPDDDKTRAATSAPDAPEPDVAERHTHESEVHPDTPGTMQHDHEDAPGRQRYADARASDYAHDFEPDGSGAHPVKPVDADSLDEDGIPDIAETEPSGKADEDADG